ncbi:MAG: CDP-alcohol phosphatidyltransferase family protein [Bacillota bacterium]|jgi:cardiolipin synthase|nr:CDP-alcohol phosphatidyltransferase family protein [Bacillota bacterium]HPZ22312.1 CDP-alcohol phosphatidyltransferase family protein [Bacillota bacterium]HQD19916.1 CDP-alcohol phosphatidyltransferase family protein [Bacillota bacterium]
MKKNYGEYFSLPNLISFLRLCLVPVYLYLFLRADSDSDYYVAAAVVLASFFSDFIDGFIARRYNMITDFGKVLDPVADKLTQAALALSITFRYSKVKILLIALIIKELLLGLAGLYMLRRGLKMDGAHMHGKISTVILYATLFVLLVIPVPAPVINILIAVCIVAMATSLILYLKLYYDMLNENRLK